MAEKRRLPVIQSKEADEPDRPPWQWTLFTALLTVAAWLPLAMLAGALAARAHDETSRSAVLESAALAIASFAAGGVTGRFSPRSPLVAAAGGGALAPLLALLLLAVMGGVSPFAFVALVIGAAGAAAGARAFLRKRARL